MRKLKGVTLIEVLVAISIFTIVSGISFGALRVYDIMLTVGNTKNYLSAEANTALNKMSAGTGSLNAGLASSSRAVVLGLNAGLSSSTANEIIFRVPSGLDSNQDIIWGDGTTANYRIRYYLGSISLPSQLIRETQNDSGVAVGTPEVLANNITSLSFALSGNSLTIDVTAAKSSQRGIIPALSVELSTQVDFKN